MLQAGARICKSLGEEFMPYLGIVMPPLLTSAQLKPDIKMTDAESTDDEDNDEDVSHCSFPCICCRLCATLHVHCCAGAQGSACLQGMLNLALRGHCRLPGV